MTIDAFGLGVGPGGAHYHCASFFLGPLFFSPFRLLFLISSPVAMAAAPGLSIYAFLYICI